MRQFLILTGFIRMNNIYLDYAATTPCDERVLESMIPYFTKKFGNPNSLHYYGVESANDLFDARKNISDFIKSLPEEIVFTSGSTESNKIIIKRVAKRMLKKGKNHVLTTKTEHKSVLDAFEDLKKEGIEVTFLDVLQDGLINLDLLKYSIKDNTSLVSVCFVNNETGVLQNIKEISKICHERGALFHTDATQALGKIDIDVKDLGIDFLSGSGHKIYAAKGIGLLFFAKNHINLLKKPRANNDVEFGIRAGTVPVALCVGFSRAISIAKEEMAEDYKRIKMLRDKLVNSLKSLDEIYFNGSVESNYPGITNVSFRGVEGEALMMESKRICVASGSACTSNKLSISHVLDAMGIKADIAQSSIRISIGKFTTESDIENAVEDLIFATNKLRAMSPVWDMVKQGLDLDAIFKNRSH